MLKSRILTALVLIPLFLLLLFTLPPLGFFMFTSIVVLWSSYEWSALMGVRQCPQCLLYPMVMLAVLWVSSTLPLLPVLYIAIVWWLAALILILSYSKQGQAWRKSVLLCSCTGFLVLVPCWLAINFLRNADHGIYLLLFLFVLIWGADIGAYCVGKRWGKNKLASLVSPGKTWEGMIGAVGVTVLVVLGVLYATKMPYRIWPATVGLSIVTVLFSIVGDLFESMLKRQAGIKDSGHLLPGHGGVLDRIDSLTAAAPVFVVGAILLSNFFH